MQSTRTKLSVFLLVLSVIASCVLHFFQLLQGANSNITLVIYGLIFISLILSAVYSHSRDSLGKILDFSSADKSYYLASIFLSITFFADFIHQCYNCFKYISSTSYVEIVYVIPLAMSALFALISCFYFITFSLTANGSNYDFRNFTFLHFSPIIWGFVKLVIIMLKIVDIKLNMESMLEFLLLVFMLVFLFCFIMAVDKYNEPVGKTFVFSALSTFIISTITALPYLVSMIIKKSEIVSDVNYTAITYIAIGLFSLVLLKKAVNGE